MKLLTIIAGLIAITSASKADQVAVMTCTGSKIILSVKSPYLGENSPVEQRLFVLKAKDSNESANAAYFLDVHEDVGPGASNPMLFVGKNEVGGSFRLQASRWTDESDGTTLRLTTAGVIDYNHGPLKGKGEPVSCVME